MIEVGGVFLPDGETHLVEWMKNKNEWIGGKLTYQYHKLRETLRYCQFRRRVAVDVGAHCGLWSMHLAKHFESLHAFEPVDAHRQCFVRNVPPDYRPDKVFLYPVALGEQEGRVAIRTAPTSSGDSWVDGEGDIPLKRLDDFLISDVDLVKLDCEGYELFALRGGEETLLRCRPCVIVEQKPGRAQKFGLAETGAVDYLKGLGAKLRKEMSGDFILSWD